MASRETESSRRDAPVDDDVEVVIHAGVRPACTSADGGADADDVVVHAGVRPGGPRADGTPPETGGAPVPVGPRKAADAPGARREDAARRPAETGAAAAAPAQPGGEEAYRRQSADDLKAPPMSTMQKALIVLAVLGVIGFVVWNTFLR